MDLFGANEDNRDTNTADSRSEGIKQTIIFGLFYGTAISSRFMLELRTDSVSQIASFVILFLIFWAVPYWFEKYRVIRGFRTAKFKVILKFCLFLFLIGALFSSLVKYCYFEYMKPAQFAMISDMVKTEMINMNQYPKEMIEEAMNYVTSFNYAASSCVMNLLLAVPMAFIVRFNYWQQEKMRNMLGKN